MTEILFCFLRQKLQNLQAGKFIKAGLVNVIIIHHFVSKILHYIIFKTVILRHKIRVSKLSIFFMLLSVYGADILVSFIIKIHKKYENLVYYSKSHSAQNIIMKRTGTTLTKKLNSQACQQ